MTRQLTKALAGARYSVLNLEDAVEQPEKFDDGDDVVPTGGADDLGPDSRVDNPDTVFPETDDPDGGDAVAHVSYPDKVEKHRDAQGSTEHHSRGRPRGGDEHEAPGFGGDWAEHLRDVQARNPSQEVPSRSFGPEIDEELDNITANLAQGKVNHRRVQEQVDFIATQNGLSRGDATAMYQRVDAEARKKRKSPGFGKSVDFPQERIGAEDPTDFYPVEKALRSVINRSRRVVGQLSKKSVAEDVAATMDDLTGALHELEEVKEALATRQQRREAEKLEAEQEKRAAAQAAQQAV